MKRKRAKERACEQGTLNFFNDLPTFSRSFYYLRARERHGKENTAELDKRLGDGQVEFRGKRSFMEQMATRSGS